MILTRTFAFGAALGVIVAWFLARHAPTMLDTFASRVVIGALICAVAWRMFFRTPRKPRPAPFQIPGVKPCTRRWARALYFNGIITIDELNRLCMLYPEDSEDGNKHGATNR